MALDRDTGCDVCHWQRTTLQPIIPLLGSMVCAEEGSCARNYVGCEKYHRSSSAFYCSELFGSIWFKHNTQSLDSHHGRTPLLLCGLSEDFSKYVLTWEPS
jgi:hypothetical protein